MKCWLVLLFAWVFGPLAAIAGPAVVTSGEHPGFTRLVVQFDRPVNWYMGRTLDGYELRLTDERPNYDMAKAFDLIGRSRLAAIWADPKTGDFHIGIACQCYAMPFEFRPGIVVVDLRDGVPPKGSSFEHPLDVPAPPPDPAMQTKYDGSNLAQPKVAVTPDAMLPVYDWTNLTLDHLHAVTGAPMDAAMTTLQSDGLENNPGLEALRVSLMDEIGRGASEGIVDFVKPKKSANPSSGDADPSVHIHLGETPNIIIRQKGKDHAPMSAKGAACISDVQLDIPAWGSSRPVSDQLGPERQGLTGEFDKADPDAVIRAVRFQLFLGFGAEARGLVRTFPDNLPDKVIWDSVARILDDVPDVNSAFAGMEDCDTAASLWATLATPAVLPAGNVGRAAVLRNFSALPPHLRRLLGPRLVKRFLAVNDIAVATSLRDAILRAPGDPGPEIMVMQAEMDRAFGKPGHSEARLEPLSVASGPSSGEALLALVEQRATLGQAVSFEQVQALEAYLKGRLGSADERRFQQVLVLARAASGDFDSAFAESAPMPEVRPVLWRILANAGPDSALLNHATLPLNVPPPPEAKAVASILADRMLGLGLADQAANWLSLADKVPAKLKARVALAQGNGQAALDVLMNDDSFAALTIKAAALQTLNDHKAAADIFAQLGKTREQMSALDQTQVWEVIAKDGSDPWKAVASVVSPLEGNKADTAKELAPNMSATEGPLARNKALVQDSSATRDAIATLLNSVKIPDP